MRDILEDLFSVNKFAFVISVSDHILVESSCDNFFKAVKRAAANEEIVVRHNKNKNACFIAEGSRAGQGSQEGPAL